MLSLRCRRALGFGLGLSLAANWGHRAATGLCGCLALVLVGGRFLGHGVAVGSGVGRAERMGFDGVCCAPLGGSWL